jgi:hypothetical protein
MATRQQIERMRERITDEIFSAFGFAKQGAIRRWFGWLFNLPASRFARLFADADEEVGVHGLGHGCRTALERISVRLHVRGSELIPREGPLLVVSNHPGAYDSLALASSVPRRDLRIFVHEVPFYRAIPHTSRYFIYTPGGNDPTGRMIALRNSIENLRSGASLLLFGSGRIEPDPAIMPGAESALERWSRSIEVLLRKVPETRLVLAITSGVLLRRFALHPFTRIHRDPIKQRRLAEFMQVIQQMVFPGTIRVETQVSFAPPVTVAELAKESAGMGLMRAIFLRARSLLKEHIETWHLQGG